MNQKPNGWFEQEEAYMLRRQMERQFETSMGQQKTNEEYEEELTDAAVKRHGYPNKKKEKKVQTVSGQGTAWQY